MMSTRGGAKMTAITKPIQQTSELKGEFAKDFLKEVMKRPSESALARNKQALALLKKMRG